MAEMLQRMIETGASTATVAVAVEAYESFRKLPETSGSITDYELAIWRKVERERKREKPKSARKSKVSAEANDAAPTPPAAPPNLPEASGNGVASTYLLTPLSSNSEEKTSEKGRKKRGGDTRARGTRLSEGLPLPDEYRRFALSEGVENPDAMWAEFVDYWIAVPGQRGCKINWLSTWRNNVRRNLARGKTHVRRPDNPLADAIDGLRQFGRSGH